MKYLVDANVLIEAKNQVANEEAALEAFDSSELGQHYPAAVKTFTDTWDRFVLFLSFPPMLRRVTYTTNSIESLNYQQRKVTQGPGPIPLQYGRRQAAVANDLQHREQTRSTAGQGEKNYQPTNEKHPAGSSRKQQPLTGNKPSNSWP